MSKLRAIWYVLRGYVVFYNVTRAEVRLYRGSGREVRLVGGGGELNIWSEADTVTFKAPGHPMVVVPDGHVVHTDDGKMRVVPESAVTGLGTVSERVCGKDG